MGVTYDKYGNGVSTPDTSNKLTNVITPKETPLTKYVTPTRSSGGSSNQSKPADASYTQGGTTYDPATKTLLPTQQSQNKVEAIATPKQTALSSSLPSVQSTPSQSVMPNQVKNTNPMMNALGRVGDTLFNPEVFRLRDVAKLNPTTSALSNTLIPNVSVKTARDYTQNQLPNNALGLAYKVPLEFVPVTGFDLAVLGAGPSVYSKIPAVGRIGLTGVGLVTGGFTALNSKATPSQRIAGGIVAGASAVGLYQESSPYIKGQAYKLFPDYKSVKSFNGPEGSYKAIDFNNGKSNIALIPAGDSMTGSKPAYTSTAYGFNKEYQSKYIDTNFDVTSSAKGFFTGTKTGSKININIPETPRYFGTPADISTGQTQTRASRLGYNNLFEFPKSDSSATTVGGTPELNLFKKASITKFGEGNSFRAGPSGQGGTTELEVYLNKATVQNKGVIGRTTINGVGVKIYEGEIISSGTDFNLPKSKDYKFSSNNEYYTSSSGYASSIKNPFSSYSKPSSSKTNSFSNIISSSSSSNSKPSFNYSIPNIPTRSSGSSKPSSSTYSFSSPPSGSSYSQPSPPSFSMPRYSPPSKPNYRFGNDYSPPNFSNGGSLDFSGGFDFKQSTKIFKGKQRNKYTPSYEAIIGFSKGKNYSGKKITGLESRGYSKGFTWFNKSKLKGFK
jgi:hypothetical protein